MCSPNIITTSLRRRRFQIGIVLASATVITGMIVLTFMAAGLGVVGLVFMAIGVLAPHVLHLHLSGSSELLRDRRRMRRRMRHNSRNARPVRSGARSRKQLPDPRA